MSYLVGGFLFLLGSLIGSFLNVCIHRMPNRESVVRPRSFCPSCRKTVAAYDNIPILSFLILQGKCRSCGWKIPLRYPLVELATACLFAGGYLWFRADPRFAVFLPFVGICVALFVIDAEHQLLPDLLTLPGTAIGLVLSPWNPILNPDGGFLAGMKWAAVGAVVGAAVPAVTIFAYWLIRGEQGMGWGDVKMLAMIGAFLGWDLTILSIVLSSFLGVAWWGLRTAAGKGGGLKEALPFGSFLALGAFASLLFGRLVLAWYGSFFPASAATGLEWIG